MTIFLKRKKKRENGNIFLRPIQNRDNSILSKHKRLAADGAAASCPCDPSVQWVELQFADGSTGVRELWCYLSHFPHRLQSGMNLQICFVNDSGSDKDSDADDSKTETSLDTPLSPMVGLGTPPEAPERGNHRPSKMEAGEELIILK